MINKVMLIDDDEVTNFYHKIIIENESFVQELVVKTTVNEALLYLEETEVEPDLIFLDMNMPLKNWLDFLEECVQRNFTVKSKIIIFSTTSNPAEIKEVLNHKLVFDFKSKPLDVEFIKKVWNKQK